MFRREALNGRLCFCRRRNCRTANSRIVGYLYKWFCLGPSSPPGLECASQIMCGLYFGDEGQGIL